MNSLRYGILFPILLLSCSKTYKTISYTDTSVQKTKLPFVKEYKGEAKSVLVFGSYHTNDAGDVEIKTIESSLNSFLPNIILYEGDYIGVGETWEESVSQFFEMGYTRWWAKKHAVTDMNIEPPAKEKNKHLLKKFDKDKVLLATILGQNILFITSHNKQEFEDIYPTYVRDIENEGLVLTTEQKTVSYFYKIYLEFYNSEFDPEHFDYETVEIKFNKTELNRINQAAAVFRDQYMLGKIEECLKTHKKIYVQVGGRHALVWQPVMHKILH